MVRILPPALQLGQLGQHAPAAALGGELCARALELDGQLPPFTANVTMAGAMGVMSWASPDFVVAMTTLEEGLPVPLDFALTGMIGSLTMTP